MTAYLRQIQLFREKLSRPLIFHSCIFSVPMLQSIVGRGSQPCAIRTRCLELKTDYWKGWLAGAGHDPHRIWRYVNGDLCLWSHSADDLQRFFTAKALICIKSAVKSLPTTAKVGNFRVVSSRADRAEVDYSQPDELWCWCQRLFNWWIITKSLHQFPVFMTGLSSRQQL